MITPRSDRVPGRVPRLGSLFTTAVLVAALLPSSPAQAQSPCSVDYRLTQDWGSGFTAEVTLTNESADLAQWSLDWEFDSGQQVTNAWSAEVSQDAASVTASGPAWAPGLARGAIARSGPPRSRQFVTFIAKTSQTCRAGRSWIGTPACTPKTTATRGLGPVGSPLPGLLGLLGEGWLLMSR